MPRIDQRGFDNPSDDFLEAGAASALLGIKRATLYAYASRGLVKSVPGDAHRSRRYLRADLERLKARHDARSGHGPVAAGALRWGEPVLESAVTGIDARGPSYRVAASSGADLFACVGAALATHSGHRHGGTCDRVEAVLAEAGHPEQAATLVRERLRRGEAVPGFGHTLYPAGDPRTPPLLEAAEHHAGRSSRRRTLLAIVEAMRKRGQEPTVDLGVVAVTAALGAPPGAAVAIFAIGRSVGWIAHALEQRAAGFIVRPRARYVGA